MTPKLLTGTYLQDFEAFASELIENLEEMFPRYYMNKVYSADFSLTHNLLVSKEIDGWMFISIPINLCEHTRKELPCHCICLTAA